MLCLLYIKVAFFSCVFSLRYIAYISTELIRFSSSSHPLFVSNVKFVYPTLFSEVWGKVLFTFQYFSLALGTIKSG